MKLKLLVRANMKNEVMEQLRTNQIEFHDDAEFILYEVNYEHDYLLVKDKDDFLRIRSEDILYIEGIGAKVMAHTSSQTYMCRDTMYALEAMLYEKNFMRIHKGYIVNKKAIERIRTSINMKFILILKNGEKIEVSRSYYYRFKEEMGF